MSEAKQEQERSNGSRFIEMFVALKGGDVLERFGDDLREVVAAVQSTGKSGMLTICVKVAPAVKNNNEVIVIEADSKKKIPQPSLGATAFFVDASGLLARENPNQMKFKLEGEQAQ